MPARPPEQLGQVMIRALHPRDVDGVVQLYEAESVLHPSPGQIVRGTSAIKQAIAGFAAINPTMTLTAKSLGQVDDIALTTARWELKGTGPNGEPVELAAES